MRDLRQQKFEFATVDRVALHDEADQGIVRQLGQRALGDIRNISPRLLAPEIHLNGITYVGHRLSRRIGASKRQKALGESVTYPRTAAADVN